MIFGQKYVEIFLEFSIAFDGIAITLAAHILKYIHTHTQLQQCSSKESWSVLCCSCWRHLAWNAGDAITMIHHHHDHHYHAHYHHESLVFSFCYLLDKFRYTVGIYILGWYVSTAYLECTYILCISSLSKNSHLTCRTFAHGMSRGTPRHSYE